VTVPEPDADAARCVLAVDQGTSATKALLVDQAGAVRATASVPIAQSHPRPGWAEQDAEEIWTSVREAVAGCLRGQEPGRVLAVGLSTQRESTLLWERATGHPLAPLLGWQDSRGAQFCDRIRAAGDGERVREVSGLPLDPMFSASKATWLLDAHDPDRRRSRAGELCLGTVDSWLLWRLTGEHVIEAGNAARTQLLDLTRRTWDPWLLDLFGVPAETLPRVVASTGPFPAARGLDPLPATVTVTGVLGDSHAALFAHAGWRAGQVKATYGTGSSVMGLTDRVDLASPGLARTLAWETNKPSFALEGNIRSSGATLVWLADLLGTTPAALAATAADSSDGVLLVPAFTGLGAPWWDDRAAALLTGFTFGTRAEHLARAALESIAFQVEDVVAEVEREVGWVGTVLADGGATDNPVLMQLQADTSGRDVERAKARDLSALGAAHMAGLGAGLWSMSELDALSRVRESYHPKSGSDQRTQRRAQWHDAVARARGAAAAPQPAGSPAVAAPTGGPHSTREGEPT
jgi:glycerol kinase